MTFDEFNALVAACRMQQPIWFELETDQPASDSEIEGAQRALAAVLLERYRSFVKQCGCGYFALGNVAKGMAGKLPSVCAQPGGEIPNIVVVLCVSDNQHAARREHRQDQVCRQLLPRRLNLGHAVDLPT